MSTVRPLVQRHRRLVAFLTIATLAFGMVGIGGPSAGAYQQSPYESPYPGGGSGWGEIAWDCLPITHQAYSLTYLSSDIGAQEAYWLGYPNQRIMVFGQYRYRVNSNYAWSRWGGDNWRTYYREANGEVLPTSARGTVPKAGEYQHRYAYYWQHFDGNGNAYWANSSWDYPTYRQFGSGVSGREVLLRYSSTCKL
jgi:hypothetical protein